MDTKPLYAPHDRALSLLFSDMENRALTLREVFTGTPGSVIERTNANGFRFYVHQSYRGGERKQSERYLAGPVGSPEAESAAAELRRRIDEIKGMAPSLRLLGREGFALVNAKTWATLASLHNHGLFRAGAHLVGSHAYGVILNRLGARATAWATEDIDIARGPELALDRVPEGGFLEMLRGSGLEFVEVPEFDHKTPSTSFKEPGRSGVVVDLLASTARQPRAIAVPELKAHAAGLPWLDYLLEESQTGALLSREGCCIVRVPLPERFAVHKLIVSRLRAGSNKKSEKDVLQAAVIAAVLADTNPGALESAITDLPERGHRHLRGALTEARSLLEAHPRALDELEPP